VFPVIPVIIGIKKLSVIPAESVSSNSFIIFQTLSRGQRLTNATTAVVLKVISLSGPESRLNILNNFFNLCDTK